MFRLALRTLCAAAAIPAAAVWLAACAPKQVKTVEVYDTDHREFVTMTDAEAEAADAMICTKTYVTGSRFPVTSCLPREQALQRKRDAKDDQDMLLRRQMIPVSN